MSQDDTNSTIDGAQKIAEQNQQRQQEQEKNQARGAATLNKSRQSGALNLKKLMLPVIIILSILIMFLFYNSYKTPPVVKKEPSSNIVRNTLPPFKKHITKPPEKPHNDETKKSDPYTGSDPHNAHNGEPAKESPIEILRKRRLTAALHQGNKSTSQNHTTQTQSCSHQQDDGTVVHLQGEQATNSNNSNNNNSTNSLGSQLQPLQLRPAFAGQLGDRNYLLTQGAVLDCVLETRLITTQPGLCMCTLTRDVYSANGRVILLDRGSKIVGHYQGNLTQGQARIFVLWTRIETPKGVIINLDSPGAGPLGEGGLGGYIDSHFWERFGGAIMLSLIDDLSEFAANQGKKTDKDQISFNNTSGSAQDMAAEALKNSINIPPTLYKNQGERITVFVARDLDFRSVYDLQLTQ